MPTRSGVTSSLSRNNASAIERWPVGRSRATYRRPTPVILALHLPAFLAQWPGEDVRRGGEPLTIIGISSLQGAKKPFGGLAGPPEAKVSLS